MTQDNLNKRLEILQNKSRQRALERDMGAKLEKAMLWHRIQTEAPQIALFLKEVNRVFGKPANFRIKWNDKIQKPKD